MDGCPQAGALAFGLSVGGSTLGGMMPLGTRVVEVPTLQDRIAARLNEVLERQVAGGFYGGSERGLVAPDLEDLGTHDVIRLSVEDVARIAAQEARSWF
jgi:hypothetical protein